MENSWVKALKLWNKDNHKFIIPKKNSKEYAQVKKLQIKMSGASPKMSGAGIGSSRPTGPPPTLEQKIDTETGLIPEVRDIVMDYFDPERFSEKFIREQINGNAFIPQKDVRLLRRVVKRIVEYTSSNNMNAVRSLINSLEGELSSHSFRVIWHLMDELDKNW